MQKTVTDLKSCSKCHAIAKFQVSPVVLKQQQQLRAAESESLQQGSKSQNSSLQWVAVYHTVSANELRSYDIMINNAATSCQHKNKRSSHNLSAFQTSH